MMLRIKKTILFILLTAAAFPAFAQSDSEIEQMMTRRQLSCTDIAYNASILIPKLYERGSRDTLLAVMRFWEIRCGQSEELLRCKVLLAIECGTFSENIYEGKMLDALRNYNRNNMVYNGQVIRWNSEDNRNNQAHLDNRFNLFTVKLAKTLLDTKEVTAVEKLILRVYANDSGQSFDELTSGSEYAGIVTQVQSIEKEKEQTEAVQIIYGLIGGVWFPRGNLELLGTHPKLGLRMGLQQHKWTAVLNMDIKFVSSPNNYQVYYDGVRWNTKKFSGSYLGLDGTYALLQKKGNNIFLAGGIGYDSITCLDNKIVEYEDDEFAKGIHALNLNIGAGYQFYFKRNRHLGVVFKYHFLNYKNPGGTNLDGDVITVSLIYGLNN